MKIKTFRCQNAADLQLPATDPANAPARAEFKLGLRNGPQNSDSELS